MMQAQAELKMKNKRDYLKIKNQYFLQRKESIVCG